MTTPENQGRDPDMPGVLRGATLIVVIGAALGIAYNAMGLASRPKHGLAWIKQAEKLESLEALQGTPATTGAAGEAGAATTGASDSEPGPGDAAAATASTPPPPKPAPASGAKSDTSAAARHADGAASAPVHGTAPAPKKAGTPTGSQAAAPAPKKGTTPAGSQAAAPGQKPATGAQATAPPATPPPTAGAPAPGAAATSAAADLPVIPDVTGPLKLELTTLKKLYAASAALVIDAREAPDYADGHISGALSLPYNDAMAEPERVKKLDPAGRPIVVYCSGGDCELSMDLARLMVEAGKRRVLVYEGGFPEWQGAGMPVTKGANP